MALFQKRLVLVPLGKGLALQIIFELDIQQHCSGADFVVLKDLLRDFVDELIKTKIDLGLDLVVKKLFSEFGQRKVTRVGVEIEWLENKLHHAGLINFNTNSEIYKKNLFCFEYMIGENPWH